MIARIIKNKLINDRPVRTVAGAALIVSIAGVLSRLLGLFRDRILAHQFGAGDTLDIYYAAFRIPDLIYNLLIVGALSAAFIPIFTSLLAKEKKEKAWRLASGLLLLQISAVIVISLVLAIFAPQLMKILTPGFSAEKMEAAVGFTRIMFLSPLLLGVSAIFGGILVSFKKFIIYSTAPIMYNIGIIIGAIFFVQWWGVIGLAWGVVLGAGLHLLIQYPAIRYAGFKFHWRNLSNLFGDKYIRKVVKLMIPRSLAMGVGQVNLLIITIFASKMATGSLASFNFANNLQSVPLGLFGISFAVAVFPRLSSLAAKKDMSKFVYTFSRTLRRILFFVVPASVVIFALRAEIVRAVLGTGKFDWEDTRTTLWILGFLSVSLFAQALIPLLARAFYALENTKTPFYIALFSEIINILIIIILIKEFQILGLAIAFSVATIVNMMLLFYFLHRKIGNLNDKKNFNSVIRIIIASLFCGFAIYFTRHFLGNFIELKTLLEVMAQLIISGGAGIMVYLLACHWLRVEEFIDFKKSILLRAFNYSGGVAEK